jgi:hypothetical protein
MTEYHERTPFGVTFMRGLVGLKFNPSIRVPAGVDADGNRVDDRLDLEIAQRVLNRLALAVC